MNAILESVEAYQTCFGLTPAGTSEPIRDDDPDNCLIGRYTLAVVGCQNADKCRLLEALIGTCPEAESNSNTRNGLRQGQLVCFDVPEPGSAPAELHSCVHDNDLFARSAVILTLAGLLQAAHVDLLRALVLNGVAAAVVLTQPHETRIAIAARQALKYTVGLNKVQPPVLCVHAKALRRASMGRLQHTDYQEAELLDWIVLQAKSPKRHSTRGNRVICFEEAADLRSPGGGEVYIPATSPKATSPPKISLGFLTTSLADRHIHPRRRRKSDDIDKQSVKEGQHRRRVERKNSTKSVVNPRTIGAGLQLNGGRRHMRDGSPSGVMGISTPRTYHYATEGSLIAPPSEGSGMCGQEAVALVTPRELQKGFLRPDEVEEWQRQFNEAAIQRTRRLEHDRPSDHSSRKGSRATDAQSGTTSGLKSRMRKLVGRL